MNCPKCGVKISPFDLKPTCKHCGVNIMYYTQEADLVKDAKMAELEFASARLVTARIKAAFVGSALAIARLVFAVIGIAAFVPSVAKITFNFRVFGFSVDIGGLGAYNLYSDGLLMSLIDFMKSSFIGTEITKASVVLLIFVLTLLAGLVSFIIYLLSFLNLKKGTKAHAVSSFITAGLAAVLQIVAIILLRPLASAGYVSVGFSFGAIAVLVAYIVIGILNMVILKKGIEPEYKPNDLLRKETLKKIKSGEVSLDDLSLPVYETEEEREERLKALEEALKKEEDGEYD